MKIRKIISIICSIIGFILAFLGLIVGLFSINAEGWGQLGVIFILPSVFAISIILFDFLIVINKIKKGLVYSYFSSLIKLGIIVLMIPSTIYDYKYEMEYGVLNLNFDLLLIVLLIVIAIPSILNIIKLSSERK